MTRSRNPASPARPDTGERLAALDFGSNTVGYLIAEQRHGELQILERASSFVRLAESLQTTATISPAALLRTRPWIEHMRAALARWNVGSVRAVGTEALRSATNSAQLRALVTDLLDVELEVLNPVDEATLIYRGVRVGYPDGPLAVLDVGGGSTELILGSRKGAEESLELGCFPRGAVTMTEELGEDWDALCASAVKVMEDFHPIALWPEELTVLGGTSANLALMDQVERRAELSELEGYVLSKERVVALGSKVRQLTSAERTRRYAIPAGRSDILLAGLAFLEAVLQRWRIPKVRVSRYCLRHGVLWSMLKGALAR